MQIVAFICAYNAFSRKHRVILKQVTTPIIRTHLLRSKIDLSDPTPPIKDFFLSQPPPIYLYLSHVHVHILPPTQNKPPFSTHKNVHPVHLCTPALAQSKSPLVRNKWPTIPTHLKYTSTFLEFSKPLRPRLKQPSHLNSLLEKCNHF